MHISYQALVLAALSLDCAFAQPAHRHQHKHKRDLADILHKRQINYNDPTLYKDVNWAEVCKDNGCAPGSPQYKASAAAAGPAATSTPASSSPASSPPADVGSGTAPASTSSAAQSKPSHASSGSSGSTSGSTGTCNDLSSVWKKGDTSRTKAIYMGDGSSCPGGCTSADGGKYTSLGGTTTPQNVGQTDGYIGNVGSPYGHNMLPLSDCDASGHDFSLTFIATNDIKVALWNKNGDDSGMPNRPQTGASRNAFFMFELAAGQKAVFAMAPNSQVAFSQACDRNGQTGQFDCTWGEADFGNTENGGASGYDRSSIPNGQGNTGLLTVSAPGFDESSQQAHSFVSTSQLNTGGKTNIPAGQPAHMQVTMG